MSKNRRYRRYTMNVMPYTGAMLVERWQMCAQIGSMLYRSNRSNAEIKEMWEKQKEPVPFIRQ